MKTPSSKPTAAAPFAPAAAKHKKKNKGNAAPNTALNAQSRRVLAQHYRAKYGVK